MEYIDQKSKPGNDDYVSEEDSIGSLGQEELSNVQRKVSFL